MEDSKSANIPKIIHLCWFSGEEYPFVLQHCIDSWRRVLPDYEIMLWDRERALSIGNRFVDEAISVKKWAFAADVVRLYALYHYGGVYMDADVFLMKRFDQFLTNSTVYFIEHHRVKVKGSDERVSSLSIQAAFIAAEKGSKLICETLKYYDNRPFIFEDGSYDMLVIAPAIFAKEAEKEGFKWVDEQQIYDDFSVYESRFIAGNRREVTKDSFGVHLCFHSWHYKSRLKLFRAEVKNFITKYILSKNAIPL